MASNSNSVTSYSPANPSMAGFVFTISFKESSTSNANNTSTISFTATLTTTSTNYSSYNSNYWCIYWKDNYQHTTPYQVTRQALTSVEKKKSYTISGTLTVNHKSDGTLSGQAGVYYYSSGGQYAPKTTECYTANTTLTKIGRKTPFPSMSGNYYVGSSYTVYLSPADNNFYHALEYTIGNKTYVGYGYSTITLNLNNNDIYNEFGVSTTHLTGQGELYTYNGQGGEVIGTNTGTFEVYLDENVCRPTLTSLTYKDTNTSTIEKTGSNQKIIKDLSTLELSFAATANKGSEIDRILLDGTSIGNVSKYTIQKPSKNSYKLQAIDKRGFRSTEQTITIASSNFIDYVALTCIVQVERNTATDGKVKINVSGNYYNGSIGDTPNSLSIQYQYKEHGTDTWGSLYTITPTIEGNTYKKENLVIGTGEFNYQKIYDFRFLVNDIFVSLDIKDNQDVTIPRGVPEFWINNEKFTLEVPLYFQGTKILWEDE